MVRWGLLGFVAATESGEVAVEHTDRNGHPAIRTYTATEFRLAIGGRGHPQAGSPTLAWAVTVSQLSAWAVTVSQ